jgi:hypothetical protein
MSAYISVKTVLQLVFRICIAFAVGAGTTGLIFICLFAMAFFGDSSHGNLWQTWMHYWIHIGVAAGAIIGGVVTACYFAPPGEAAWHSVIYGLLGAVASATAAILLLRPYTLIIQWMLIVDAGAILAQAGLVAWLLGRRSAISRG